MDNTNKYEQEIDLKNLLFAVLRNWRIIILATFLLAITFGGFKISKELLLQQDKKYIADIEEKYNNDIEQYTQLKGGYEREIESLTSNIAFQQNYQDNSILLKIDPYNNWKATADVYIKMDEMPLENRVMFTSVDYADSIVKAYESSINKGNSLNELSKSTNIDLTYLKELIDVETDYISNMVSINVTYTDKKGAELILNTILDSLTSMYPDFCNSLGKHTISILNQDVSNVTNQELVDIQKTKFESLNSLNNSLRDSQKALKDLEEPQRPITLSKTSILKAGIKYGIFGGVFGCFMVALFVSIIYLMNDKVRTGMDIKEVLGIKVLGVLEVNGKKRFFSIIDSWLDRIEGMDTLPIDTIYDLVAVNIMNYFEIDQRVLLTGMVEDDALQEVANKLRQRIPNLKIEVGGNLNKSPKLLQKIYEFEGIILVEKRNKSKFKEIQNEVDTINNMNKDIIGCIVL